MKVSARSIVLWIGMFFLFWFALMAAGALLGGIIYPVTGWAFGLEMETEALFRKGLYHGYFMLGLVWGPGLALVMTIMRVHTLRKRRQRMEG